MSTTGPPPPPRHVDHEVRGAGREKGAVIAYCDPCVPVATLPLGTLIRA